MLLTLFLIGINQMNKKKNFVSRDKLKRHAVYGKYNPTHLTKQSKIISCSFGKYEKQLQYSFHNTQTKHTRVYNIHTDGILYTCAMRIRKIKLHIFFEKNWKNKIINNGRIKKRKKTSITQKTKSERKFYTFESQPIQV